MKPLTPLERILREAAPLVIAVVYIMMIIALLYTTESIPVLQRMC